MHKDICGTVSFLKSWLPNILETNQISTFVTPFRNYVVRKAEEHASTITLVMKAFTLIAAAYASMFLYFINPLFFRPVMIIVGYSIFDEIIARGVIQNGIHGIQRLYNHMLGRGTPTEEQLTYQVNFRVILAALCRAGLQMVIANDLTHRILLFAFTTLGGISCGYVYEKKKSLLHAVVLHAAQNSAVILCTAKNLSFVRGLVVIAATQAIALVAAIYTRSS